MNDNDGSDGSDGSDEEADVRLRTKPWASSFWKNTAMALGIATCIMITLWVVFFVIGCLLIHRANVPAVHAACGGFWEFMVVALVSPALIPFAYAILGLGIFAWQDFYAISSFTLTVAALYMTLSAANNTDCQDAIRATTPPEPWLIFFGWLKVVAYGSATVSVIFTRYVHPQ